MKRWARAAPAILLGALAALTIVAAPAYARASDAAKGASSSLEVTPVGATGALAIDPGASAQRAFVVTNRSSSLRLTVRLAAVDATTGAGGAVQYARDASPSGPGSWLTLSDLVTTLEPGAHVRVSMTITPPDNATPGAVTAGLVARIDQAARVSDNQTVAASGEVSLPVAIKVKGAATALVSIASVQATSDGGHDYLSITFQNSGATPATMSGQVRVAGAQPATHPVRATVPPLTHVSVRVPFTKPSGSNTVPVSVSTQDANGNEATWGGAIGSGAADASAPVPSPTPSVHHATRVAPAGGSAYPSPVLIGVALLFLAAAVWFGLEFRRSRRPRVRAAAAPVTVAPTTASAVAAPVVAAAPVDAGQMGAVATQLAALVASIDRLVVRLGDAPGPMGRSAPAPPSPRVPEVTPVPANPAPQFFAPAARRGPEVDFDPYDWPTQQQLDDFVARRRGAQSDS